MKNKPPTKGTGGIVKALPSKGMPSQQWFSESTQAGTAQATDEPPIMSPSQTPAPPKPECVGEKYEKSEPLEEVSPNPLEVFDPKDMGQKDSWGAAGWAIRPDIFATPVSDCDGEAKVWRGRVVGARFQVKFYVGTTPKPLNQAAIDGASCSQLQTMLTDLQALIATADPDNPNGWVPEEFVRAHEMVHVNQLIAAAKSCYAGFVARVEAITASCSRTSEEAEAQMSSKFTQAGRRFRRDLRVQEILTRNHQPAADFINAVSPLVNSWIDAVNAKMEELGC